jgi:hypothetical protein
VFIANFLILMQLGANHVESPFIEFGQISTVLVFLYFIVVMYSATSLENTFVGLYGPYMARRMRRMMDTRSYSSKSAENYVFLLFKLKYIKKIVNFS